MSKNICQYWKGLSTQILSHHLLTLMSFQPVCIYFFSKKQHFEECNQTVCVPIDPFVFFCPYNGSQWKPKLFDYQHTSKDLLLCSTKQRKLYNFRTTWVEVNDDRILILGWTIPPIMLLCVQWGEKIFDPLLILYVCPLTKKWSVYNFNGRFILTVRDRITTTTKKQQKNAFQKSYKLICILMSEISIWSLRKTWLSTWWQNPCWQSQRSDVSCSWSPGLHTSQEWFCPTPLCRSSPSH